MFVYVWLRSEICQCEMNAEWSNKCGECWFPEFYANQSSLTHSSRCNSLLNVTLHTHSFCHTLTLTLTHAHKIKQLLLVCDIITPTGETQKRQVRVISVTHRKRWDLRKNNVQLKHMLDVCWHAMRWVSVSVWVKRFLEMQILRTILLFQ